MITAIWGGTADLEVHMRCERSHERLLLTAWAKTHLADSFHSIYPTRKLLNSGHARSANGCDGLNADVNRSGVNDDK